MWNRVKIYDRPSAAPPPHRDTVSRGAEEQSDDAGGCRGEGAPECRQDEADEGRDVGADEGRGGLPALGRDRGGPSSTATQERASNTELNK